MCIWMGWGKLGVSVCVWLFQQGGGRGGSMSLKCQDVVTLWLPPDEEKNPSKSQPEDTSFWNTGIYTFCHVYLLVQLPFLNWSCSYAFNSSLTHRNVTGDSFPWLCTRHRSRDFVLFCFLKKGQPYLFGKYLNHLWNPLWVCFDTEISLIRTIIRKKHFRQLSFPCSLPDCVSENKSYLSSSHGVLPLSFSFPIESCLFSFYSVSLTPTQ